jgi:hypothetical protein
MIENSRVAHPSRFHREGWVIRATREPLSLHQETMPEKTSRRKQPRHFDRSCSRFHREQRSGGIRFSTHTPNDSRYPLQRKSLVSLEILNRPLVLLSLLACRKRTQILTPPGLRILVPRINPKLTCLQFTNHLQPPLSLVPVALWNKMSPMPSQFSAIGFTR